MTDTWMYDFHPHEKQARALQSTAREILYGGAVAGGKSEVLLAACIDLCTLVPGAKALLVRRTTNELTELKERLRKRVPKHVATLNKVENTYYFANGSMLIMRFLDSEEDATKVQGFELQLACFDELTHYELTWYSEVLSRLRATGDVKRRMDELGFVCRALSASNPGGRGHSWVKDRFVDPAPMGMEFEPAKGEDGSSQGGTRLFIQATLWDNPYIEPEEYIRDSLGPLDPVRKRALLNGDWSIPAGTRFPQFRVQPVFDEEGNEVHPGHVIPVGSLPIDFIGPDRVVGVDVGFHDPSAFVWMARVGTKIVVYRDHVENELTPRQQAEKLVSLEDPEERLGDRRVTAVLDPSAWRRDVNHVGPKLGGDEAPKNSQAWHYQQVLDGDVVKGDNARIEGWSLFDELMVLEDDGLPRLLIFEDCRDLIKAIQSAPRQKNRPDDVQSTPKWPQDHVLDAARYAFAHIMGLPSKRVLTEHEKMAAGTPDTILGNMEEVRF